MINPVKKNLSPLILAAVGVVFGDIGTSPLYAFKMCFISKNIPVSSSNVLGLTSLLIWTLFIVVSIKYIHITLRTDNKGEGGILALVSRCLRIQNKVLHHWALCLGTIGTALFYGDGVITPAISVVSALEGLNLISPVFEQSIPLLAIVVLILLFLLQKNGSRKLGMFFGPIMIVWFTTLAVLGGFAIANQTRILLAFNPYYGARFLWEHGIQSFFALGGIVLVITGVEALYSDLGHFGKYSIEFAWKFIVFPALILNYLGQGALLLQTPEAIINPFYLLMPAWGLYPLIVLAALSTCIASQSIISGVFSLSWQAIQLGYFPRMRVIHTSHQQIGQVYVPLINYLMLLCCIFAVLYFQNSKHLAAAYSVTVTAIMLITTVMTSFLAFHAWKWHILKISLVFIPFLIIDLTFFGTNFLKLDQGGWFPILIFLTVYSIISTWRKGRTALALERIQTAVSLKPFIRQARDESKFRIPGVAIFMGRTAGEVPNVLKIHLRHNKYLFETNILLSIVNSVEPKIDSTERVKLILLEKGVYQVIAYYGFTEVPDLKEILKHINEIDATIEFSSASVFVCKSIPVASKVPYLSSWAEKLYIFLSHNSMNAIDFFKIPNQSVIELGIRIKI